MTELERAAAQYHSAVRVEAQANKLHTRASEKVQEFYSAWKDAERDLLAATDHLHRVAGTYDAPFTIHKIEGDVL